MIRHSRTRLHNVTSADLLSLVEVLCHESIEVSPIFECVKIFARVNADGAMTYARHSSDLGTTTVTAKDIVSRFKDQKIGHTVLEALELVEENLVPLWPFSPGSSSWIQLEVLDNSIRINGPLNKPAVVIRKAVRLSSSKSGASIKTTPLLERMFTRFESNVPESLGRFKVMVDPKIRLKNIAGTGVVTECVEKIGSGAPPSKVAERVAYTLISENLEHEPFLSPGFSFVFEGQEYQVTSCTYGNQLDEAQPVKQVLPLPIVGVRR